MKKLFEVDMSKEELLEQLKEYQEDLKNSENTIFQLRNDITTLQTYNNTLIQENNSKQNIEKDYKYIKEENVILKISMRLLVAMNKDSNTVNDIMDIIRQQNSLASQWK